MARVVVIDDDAGTREGFEQILRLDGHTVECAATGGDAFRLIRARIPDLVLADLRLPDFDGLTLRKRLLDAGVELPFVLLTGFASTTTAFEAGRLGVAAYLEKPIYAGELLHVLQVYGRGSKTLRDEVERDSSSAHTRRALKMIAERYVDPTFDIHAAAAGCGVTREHLARVIREGTGKTFTDLLRGRRMQEARRLLMETDLRIKEIYQQVGLISPSEFDHLFKHTWGISPTEYRLMGSQNEQERADTAKRRE
ncbi:MAG: hypothetical protein C5B57_01100 [Blastocatellia bacterium]|nr:MAG: hypothetical protein C5B57_01100 [Blastocatellia bacterium]